MKPLLSRSPIFLISMVPALAFAQQSTSAPKPAAPSAPKATVAPTFSPIPAIMNLNDGDVVPASVYTTYDSRTVAAAIIKRLHAKDEAADNSPNPEMNYLKNTNIQMLAHSSSVTGLIANGFQNQHQYPGSGGAYEPSTRAQVEDVMAHVTLEANYVDGASNPVNAVRPKYSMLTFNSNADGQRSLVNDTQYGNVIFSFNDAVKQRATFTPMDSLDLYFYEGATGLASNIRTLFFSSSDEIQKMTLDPASNQYWEAQVWGALDMSDVSFILVNCPGSDAPAPSELSALIATKVPVYGCAVSDGNSAFVRAGSPLTAPPGSS